MEQLSQWVKNLIFIILFTTLMEMFLPENNMRKYVRLVLGLFIISIFIAPLTAIFRSESSTIYQVIPDNIDFKQWEGIESQGEEVENTNHQLIEEYYNNKIKEKVQQVLKLDFPEYHYEIYLAINDEYQVASLEITLSSELIEKVKIDPIEIGSKQDSNNSQKDNNPETTISQTERVKIKRKISQLFQIPENRINIKYQGGDNGAISQGN